MSKMWGWQTRCRAKMLFRSPVLTSLTFLLFLDWQLEINPDLRILTECRMRTVLENPSYSKVWLYLGLLWEQSKCLNKLTFLIAGEMKVTKYLSEILASNSISLLEKQQFEWKTNKQKTTKKPKRENCLKRVLQILKAICFAMCQMSVHTDVLVAEKTGMVT